MFDENLNFTMNMCKEQIICFILLSSLDCIIHFKGFLEDVYTWHQISSIYTEAAPHLHSLSFFMSFLCRIQKYLHWRLEANVDLFSPTGAYPAFEEISTGETFLLHIHSGCTVEGLPWSDLSFLKSVRVNCVLCVRLVVNLQWQKKKIRRLRGNNFKYSPWAVIIISKAFPFRYHSSSRCHSGTQQ